MYSNMSTDDTSDLYCVNNDLLFVRIQWGGGDLQTDVIVTKVAFDGFLRHNAMHKHGLCYHAVSVCPSRSCIC